jgi:chromosome partitioning protein
MRRIAIINQKGGVGKTTTTANLAAALARAGQRVLAVDLDPQAHLTLHYGVTLSDSKPSVYDVLTSSAAAREALTPVTERLELLPTDVDLAGAEMELVSVPGREVILRQALTPLEDDFDYLMIDCPPALGVLTINALVACDEVLIPLQPHFFGLQGLGKLLDTVTLVKKRIHPRLRVLGIILCMNEPSTKLATEVIDDLRSFLESTRDAPVAWAEAKLFENSIRRNIKLAEASSYGRTVFDYAPRSNGAIDYARLASEVFEIPAGRILSFLDSSSPESEGDGASAIVEQVPVFSAGPAVAEPPALTMNPPSFHPDSVVPAY